MDHLASEAAIQRSKPERIIILPSSFQGRPRAMQQNYQDAIGIVRKCGKPDLFIAFTCNPRWKEIEQPLFPDQTPSDRSDLIARVFKLKLKQLIEDIVRNHIFERAVAHSFVIEFQKRGLSHCHMLIILASESKPRDSNSVDRIVSSEIPDADQNPQLYEMGHDCANIKLELPVKDGATFAKTLERDEIKVHLDARYVSAPEAVWRLFACPLHDKSHSIIRLAIHLPNMQPVYFAERNVLEALDRATEKDATLIA
ncbi:unnamed protein product [Rotaria magnacalcarata]|uniref:Helitron helicase-like domain-containing protein n=1 Tax=Rotaria magnacalcarata TaxID=392030 RepID=A0A820B996_9BILA|nr:unnamed protein product [Rotaria magnacalcarata]CAF4198697.1 unnamed protein product [Rotaria magnacalcarata]